MNHNKVSAKNMRCTLPDHMSYQKEFDIRYVATFPASQLLISCVAK